MQNTVDRGSVNQFSQVKDCSSIAILYLSWYLVFCYNCVLHVITVLL